MSPPGDPCHLDSLTGLPGLHGTHSLKEWSHTMKKIAHPAQDRYTWLEHEHTQAYIEDQQRWPRDLRTPCASPACANLTTDEYCSLACQTQEDALREQHYAQQDPPILPYSFPDFTTFEATYVGNHEDLNGIAQRLSRDCFYFVTHGMTTGFHCTYSEVALGPGIV
jgi:hypothetical protein